MIRTAGVQPLDVRHTSMSAGNKAAGLTGLLALGLPVPPAWVVPTDALEDVVLDRGLGSLVDDVERAVIEGHGWQPLAWKLRAALLDPDQALPGWLEAGLEALFATLSRGASLAFRSSATCEGVAGASFAGQFETFLAISNGRDAITAVRGCWASLWSPAALSYRAGLAAPAAVPLGMGIVIQQFVPAVAAGAVRAGADGADVEAVWGLGPALMSGRATPDWFRFARDRTLLARHNGFQDVRAQASGGNIEWQLVAPREREAPSIDESTARTLAAMAFQVVDQVGGAVEIEWAAYDGQVWLLQSRSVDGQRTLDDEKHRADLRGIPAAPGSAEGPVHMVRTTSDLRSGQPWDVVVTPYFEAALGHAFRGVAIVTEAGGTCSHAATIARERGIPLVVSVRRATRTLTAGARVRVNGTTGAIQTVEE